MDINKLIKELRQQDKLTQQDLANDLKIDRQVIANWENGHSRPKLEMVVDLADYFNVSTDYLLGRTDNKQTLHNFSNTQNGITIQGSPNSFNNNGNISIGSSGRERIVERCKRCEKLEKMFNK
ncbi:MAG: helix-turn-helix domain-containing protein [Firmicutes bacterium]|nr:helix-turn-helix domain-containing protein [Bacillota bacterium]